MRARRIRIQIFLALAAAVFAAAVPAQAATVARLKHVTLTVALRAAAKPGTTDWVAIHMAIAPGWHSYWRNPGEAGLATQIAWTLPTGVTAGAVRWPVPLRIRTGTIVSYGYERAVTLLVPLKVARRAETGSAVATIDWLLCSDMCIPQSATLRFALDKPFGDAALFPAVFAALPKPFRGTARYTATASALTLTVTGTAGAAANSVQFFPATTGAVEDAVPPQIRRDGNALTIRFRRARHAGDLDGFSGVLRVGDGRAFVIHATPAPAPPPAPPGPAFTFGVAGAALFALLGGLILNLMPCVLPILSMKALALVQSGERAAEMRRDGLFYAAGVIVSFALMASVLIALKSAGAAIGWGFQLQSPLLVLCLWLLVSAIGLNLLGVFEVPLSLAGVGGRLVGSGSGSGAFFTGVLAVLVASPCTAPFMGAALGFAMTQPPPAAFVVFLALGVGFAAPLTMFTLVPAAGRLIPRPGPWMVRFKELLAFPMLATAIWLLWVLERQTGADGLVRALGVGLGLVFLAWLVRAVGPVFLRWAIAIGGVGVLAPVALGLAASSPNAASAGNWRPWSPQAVQAARAAGHPVLVDFSAAWCVTCLVNERVALESPSVERRLERDHVVTLKGDWTSRDPAISAVLARYGRAGVPLYLVYPAAGAAKAIVLPQLLTPGAVNAALEQVAARS